MIGTSIESSKFLVIPNLFRVIFVFARFSPLGESPQLPLLWVFLLD